MQRAPGATGHARNVMQPTTMKNNTNAVSLWLNNRNSGADQTVPLNKLDGANGKRRIQDASISFIHRNHVCETLTDVRMRKETKQWKTVSTNSTKRLAKADWLMPGASTHWNSRDFPQSSGLSQLAYKALQNVKSFGLRFLSINGNTRPP